MNRRHLLKTLAGLAFVPIAKGLEASDTVTIEDRVFRNRNIVIDAGPKRVVIQRCRFLNCGVRIEGSPSVRIANCEFYGAAMVASRWQIGGGLQEVRS